MLFAILRNGVPRLLATLAPLSSASDEDDSFLAFRFGAINFAELDLGFFAGTNFVVSFKAVIGIDLPLVAARLKDTSHVCKYEYRWYKTVDQP